MNRRLKGCVAALTMLAASCAISPTSGPVQDEALMAGRPAASFPAADEDYFQGMDGGVALTADEIKGRNTWIVWTGGDDAFWDRVTLYTFGNFDLLKTLSSYPGQKFSRDNRWTYLGLINEPCFTKATGPNPQRNGLWLDMRSPNCPADPFENEQKYPGVAIGARGKTVPVGSQYGYATGVVGLRLFPNPAFDAEAAKKWDPVRYYTDPSYYNDKNLVRPYRVGMSCGFCHVGPNPVNPPADPENPQWNNLSSLVGAQYFWPDRIFSWAADESNFIFQVLHTARPGSLDTSLVATDYLNNPRTMNAVYNVGPRLASALRWGKEQLAGGGLNNRQFNDYLSSGPLTRFFQPPATVWTPHVLKDGSDSVGALGALNRVYINIGLFSEEWVHHFTPLVGGTQQSPITIADLTANSTYWNATTTQTPDMALFLIKASSPHKLSDAPGGAAYLTESAATLQHGKIVFADNCARCHSSKVPVAPVGADPGACIGPDYMTCFNRYWAWTQTGDFKSKMRPIVLAPDFLDGNFLSNDMRIPVTLTQTNACSPLATNSIRDHVWDNFSSESYKQLPSVGTITVYDPFTGAPKQYTMPAGGRRLHPRPLAHQHLVHRALPAQQQHRQLRPEVLPSRRAWVPSTTPSARCCGPSVGIRTPSSVTVFPVRSTAPRRPATCASPPATCPISSATLRISAASSSRPCSTVRAGWRSGPSPKARPSICSPTCRSSLKPVIPPRASRTTSGLSLPWSKPSTT